MDLTFKGWRESLQLTPDGAKIHSITPNVLTLIFNTPFPPIGCGLQMKVSLPLSLPFLSPNFVTFSGAFRISKLHKIYKERRRVRIPARSRTLTRVHEPRGAGSWLQNTFHSSRSGTPLRCEDWSGRPRSERRGS